MRSGVADQLTVAYIGSGARDARPPGREQSVPKILFNSVDEYISSQPETLQCTLTRVRGAILKAVPDADEMISFGLPTYKLAGAP